MTDSTLATVPSLLLDRLAKTPERAAFQTPDGEGWRTLTWKDVGAQVRAIASGLRALGLEPEQRCALLSGTRIEWIFADLGVLCAGGATTTVYPASTPDECVFILTDSASAFVFAENDDQVAKLVEKRAELPAVQKVIVFDGGAGHDGWVITLDELRAKGEAAEEEDAGAFERIARAVKSDSLATLIYTSGTTGQPKGVELTHDNWAYEAEAIDALGLLREDHVQLLWLPLAHSFGKVLEVAQIRIGFSSAVDGRVDEIVDNLASVQPTFVAAVPRIFEKVHAKVVTTAAEGGFLKRLIFNWACRVGLACSRKIQEKKPVGGFLGFKQSIADKLVFSKLRARFGGRLEYFVSGSAPLSREIAEFFHGAGVLILEGYGLTESSAATFVNRPDRYRIGTVGLPMPGTEVKIAEDGEILLRGRGIMRGYHGLPEATAETIDADGYLLTGDVGHLDDDGFLAITDRKKDLIKTAGGKYVAPQLVEGKLRADCPYVSQAVVHGDRRKFCSALISLEEEALRRWAGEQGFSGSYAELSARPEAHALIAPYVEEVNATLPSYSTIKRFALLPADLTQEAGELTASLKVKRRVVEKKYMSMLDALYADA